MFVAFAVCFVWDTKPDFPSLAMFNGSVIYGTHDGKVVRRGERNGKMA